MYIIDSKPERLDTKTAEDLQDTLQKLHTKHQKIFCCCKGMSVADYSPLSLHVRQRDMKFSLVKDPGSSPHHFRDCRHNDITKIDAAKLGYAEKAISTDKDERTVIRLNFSLKNAEVCSLEPNEEFTFNGTSRARKVFPQASLLGLLHLFWERAGLHRYRPEYALSVPQKIAQIRGAARHIRMARAALTQYGLEEHLLLPCVGTDEQQAAQKKANYAKLCSAHKQKKKVIFLVTVVGLSGFSKLIDQKNRVSFRDQLNVTVRTAEPSTFDALLNGRFPAAKAAFERGGEAVVLFGVAKTHIFKDNAWAELENLVAMPITKDWIPCQSSHEMALADVLVEQGRSFEKPLTYENTDPVFPDFVLEDCPYGKHVLEVYGVEGRDEYERRRDEKRAIYAKDYPNRYWEWDAVAEKDIAKWLSKKPLPAAKARG